MARYPNPFSETQEALPPMTELEKQMREIELARGLLEFGARRIENPELAVHISIAISLNRLTNWITRTNSEPRTPQVREPFERNER